MIVGAEAASRVNALQMVTLMVKEHGYVRVVIASDLSTKVHLGMIFRMVIVLSSVQTKASSLVNTLMAKMREKLHAIIR